MKIALIAVHFSEYSFRLAQALARNHEVLLCVNKKNFMNEVSESIQATPSPTCRIAWLPDTWLRSPLEFAVGVKVLAWTIRKFEPDIVHCQEAVRDYLMVALQLLPRYPLVLTIHDHVPHTGQDSSVSQRVRFYKSFLRQRADLVIVHGNQIRQDCERLMPWLIGRIESIPHGPLGGTMTLPRTCWNNGTLLFFGRIEAYKGLGYLIEAVRLLKNDGITVKVIIAGTGSDLVRHRQQLVREPCFELLDRYIGKEEITDLFARTDIVVMPYTDATQSGVAAMALNYRRPVIATAVGSIAEMVHNGGNGLLVPPRNSEALADAIRSIAFNRKKLAEMSAHAAILASNDFSWDSIGRRTEVAYERVRQCKNDQAVVQSHVSNG